MKDHNSEFLLGVFPHLFSYFIKTYEDRAKHQFAVGDGWYPIIYEACEAIADLRCKYSNSLVKTDFVQIKEKFGTLRLYEWTKVENESWFSQRFRKIDGWVRTQMCKRGFYKAYWSMHRFRRKWLYETLYEKVSTIIGKAEGKSSRVCEVCGGAGKRCNPSGYWILTLCEKHEKEKKGEKLNGFS